jgi:hypothetical protein
MAISEQQIEKFASRTDRPIPGQSLTTDPDNPAAYERPPLITTKEKGVDYLLDIILVDETYSAIMEALADDVPVMDLVQGILVNAFEEGVFNPDLMLLLAEPLAYLLLGLSERQGIRARIVNDPDEPYDPNDLDNWDYAEEEPMESSSNSFKEKMQSIQKPKADKDLNLDKIIENTSSLMSKPSKTNSK